MADEAADNPYKQQALDILTDLLVAAEEAGEERREEVRKHRTVLVKVIAGGLNGCPPGTAEIDAPLAEAVRLMNEAGMFTNQCCQGGIERDGPLEPKSAYYPFVSAAHVGFGDTRDPHLPALKKWAKAAGYHYFVFEKYEPVVEAFDSRRYGRVEEARYLCALNRRFIKDLTAWAARHLEEQARRGRAQRPASPAEKGLCESPL